MRWEGVGVVGGDLALVLELGREAVVELALPFAWVGFWCKLEKAQGPSCRNLLVESRRCDPGTAPC